MITGTWSIDRALAVKFGQPEFRSQVLSILLDRLQKGSLKQKRNAAAALGSLSEYLSRTEKARVVRSLVDALKSEDYTLKINAIYSLGQLGDRSVVSYLVPYLRRDDVSTEMRQTAIDAITMMKATEAIPDLLAFIQRYSSRSQTVKAAEFPAVIRALGQLGAARAVPLLISYVKSPASSIRAASMRALGRIGDRRAIKPLSEYLYSSRSSSKWMEREVAVEALGRFKGPDVDHSLLVVVNQDAHPRVRIAAGKILMSRDPPPRLLDVSFKTILSYPYSDIQIRSEELIEFLQESIQALRERKTKATPKKTRS